ncbi:hypothetical protein MGA3_15516 [Bacillus methanolicus MGA3]|nr:hypothetical protein MGA3_15516 [Bacillus methanolicus MGA3]
MVSSTYAIGVVTLFDFAKAIFKEAGINPELILPTTSDEYGAIAPIPVLGHDALLKKE